MNKKSKMFILSILLLGLILIIVTYAWFTWRSSESRLVLTIGDIDDAQVILKPYKIDKEIIPVLTYEGEEYTEVEAINKNNDTKMITLYYHINKIDNELISSDFKYMILRSTDNGNTYSEYITGNFSNAENDSDLYIMNERLSMNTDYKYRVYLWLDGSDSGQGNISGKSFNGELRTEILDGRIYANLGGDKELYKADEYREKITKVEFVNNMEIPNGSITFDLGAYPSKIDDVKGWLISNGTDTYTLKIGANDKIYVKSLLYAFYNMINLKEISFDNLDTGETISMSNMFSGCSGLTSLDLSSFNTSKVITMRRMFNGCSGLTTLDLNNFDTSEVNEMYAMFYNCSSLTSLNISSFNTSKVTTMQQMFSNCSDLTSLDLSNLDVSNVITFESMFYYCNKLTSLDLSNFKTLNAETMAKMFYKCSNLTNLNLSGFNTSKVINMETMFADCNKLTSLNLSEFNTSNVISMSNMFADCSSLTLLDISNFNTSKVENMTSMFYNCNKLTTLDLSNFDTSKVNIMQNMFSNCSNITKIYVSNKWNTNLVTDSVHMFYGCTKLPNYNSSVVDKTNAHYNTGGYLIYKEYNK